MHTPTTAKTGSIERRRTLAVLAAKVVCATVLAFVVVGFVTATDAGAVAKQRRFVFSWEGNFTDGQFGDYWTTMGTDNHAAMGIFVKIRRNTWPYPILYNDYADQSGYVPPLSTGDYLDMDSDYTYTITMYAKAKVSNDNVIWLRNNDVAHDDVTQAVTYQPPAQGDYRDTKSYAYQLLTEDEGNYRASNVIAAGSFAIDRLYGQITGNNWYMYLQACDGGGSCMDDGKVKIGGGDRAYKFMIVHEMGHYLGWKKNGNESAMSNCDYTGSSPCGSTSGDHHLISSEEYQSCAANEGFAHFYAAAIWNYATANDCEYWYPYGAQSGYWDCGSGNNRLENVCGESESDTYRGCEFDWLRFWWDIYTSAGFSFGVIANAWGDSDVDNWQNSDAYLHLKSGAAQNGISQTTFGLYGSYNGVDHHADP